MIFLGLGLWRRELATLFWGGLFTFLLFLSWGTVALVRRKIRKSHPDPLEGWETDPEATQEIPCPEFYFNIPSLPFPAYKLTLKVLWTFTPGRNIRAKVPLQTGENRGVFQVQGHRGRYDSTGPVLEIADSWGFFRSRLIWPAPGSLTILPQASPVAEESFRPSGQGDRVSRSPLRVRSSELLEVRKYYPGDDLKRINWSLYAHLGDLFLRIGEENPPPEGRIGLLLDLAPGSWEPDRELDIKISWLLGAADLLSSLGWGVIVLIPGEPSGLDWSKEDMKIPQILSGCRPGRFPLPAAGPELRALAVVSHKSSPELENILKGLEEGGIQPQVFLPPMVPGEKTEKRAWWQTPSGRTVS